MDISRFQNEYVNLSGTKLTRSKIAESPLADYKDKIIVMSSLGPANRQRYQRHFPGQKCVSDKNRVD